VSQTDPKAILSRTLDIIRERGWSADWSNGPGTPLNIRSAISVACTDLVGLAPHPDWTKAYHSTVTVVMNHIGTGITNWEYTKTHAQIEAMLTEILNRLEASS
jgi:hypothetical protein